MIDDPSGETSTDIHVPSSVVNFTVRGVARVSVFVGSRCGAWAVAVSFAAISFSDGGAAAAGG